MTSENLFKSIGDVATNIDAQVDRPQEGKQQDVAVGFEDENREVQEVESMCMECGKNVSRAMRGDGHLSFFVADRAPCYLHRV